MAYETDLKYLGEGYQYSLVHEFFADTPFFKDLESIIDQNCFTNSELRSIVGVMKDIYEEHDCVPTYDDVKSELADKSTDSKTREQQFAVLDKVISYPMNNVDGVHEKAIKFFRRQNIVKTANKILKLAQGENDDQYENCVNELSEALSKGLHEEEVVRVFDHYKETISDDYRVPIPTGIECIDGTLEGGIGKGELGVIVGPSSFGKTSLTTAIAGYAAACKKECNNNQGFKVLQIVFEDRIKQIQRKHFGRITGIEAKDLSKEEFKQIVIDRLQSFPQKRLLHDNLRIVRFHSGEKTAGDIKKFIKKLTNNDFRPDLVIVDYFECLRHVGPSSMSEWDKEGKTMREFEAMANELNIAFWIPVQGTKDSLKSDVVGMDQAGGSFKKIQIAHIVWTIARTMEDIEQGRATFAIIKNRAGQAGRTWTNIGFNNGTCTIDDREAQTYDSMNQMYETKKQEKLDMQKDVLREFKIEQDELNKKV